MPEILHLPVYFLSPQIPLHFTISKSFNNSTLVAGAYYYSTYKHYLPAIWEFSLKIYFSGSLGHYCTNCPRSNSQGNRLWDGVSYVVVYWRMLSGIAHVRDTHPPHPTPNPPPPAPHTQQNCTEGEVNLQSDVNFWTSQTMPWRDLRLGWPFWDILNGTSRLAFIYLYYQTLEVDCPWERHNLEWGSFIQLRVISWEEFHYELSAGATFLVARRMSISIWELYSIHSN